MKRIFCAIIFAIYLFSCKKTEEEFWKPYTASVLINGEKWDFVKSNYAAGTKKLWISMLKFNENQNLRKSINIGNMDLIFDKKIQLKYQKAGLLDTSPTAFFYTYGADGDVLTEHYDILETNTTDNWVKLTKKSDKEISGEFQVAFKYAYIGVQKTQIDLPDTFYITNGKFLARLRE